jgi:hypothetical protein
MEPPETSFFCVFRFKCNFLIEDVPYAKPEAVAFVLQETRQSLLIFALGSWVVSIFICKRFDSWEKTAAVLDGQRK